MAANTGFLGENPAHKGNFRTSYGNFLCIQFAVTVARFNVYLKVNIIGEALRCGKTATPRTRLCRKATD